jgi:hypothetical protein
MVKASLFTQITCTCTGHWRWRKRLTGTCWLAIATASTPTQASEIVEFTIKGQFIGELSVDATPGGAFGLSLVGLNDNKIRFAAVDDNANVLKLMTVNVPDSLPTP